MSRLDFLLIASNNHACFSFALVRNKGICPMQSLNKDECFILFYWYHSFLSLSWTYQIHCFRFTGIFNNDFMSQMNRIQTSYLNWMYRNLRASKWQQSKGNHHTCMCGKRKAGQTLFTAKTPMLKWKHLKALKAPLHDNIS